ncbi:hypothetical protein AB0K16_57335 [Nonomuraea jabiensis]|uniref:hypothetical protein n=1 Tax=Nonomuraea jabiensis TaxID=882448 RepID=UPI0034407A47
MGLAYLGIALADHYRRAQQSRGGLDAAITASGINLADNADALRDGLPDDAWLRTTAVMTRASQSTTASPQPYIPPSAWTPSFLT